MLRKNQIIIKKIKQQTKIGNPKASIPIGNQVLAPINGVRHPTKYTIAVTVESTKKDTSKIRFKNIFINSCILVSSFKAP